MAQRYPIPPEVHLDDNQYIAGRELIVPTIRDSGEQNWDVMSLHQQPGDVGKGITSARMKMVHLMRPKEGWLPWSESKKLDKLPSAYPVTLSDGSEKMTRYVGDDEGFALWPSTGEGIVHKEDAYSMYPQAGKFETRGNTVLATDLRVVKKDFKLEIPDGPEFTDSQYAQLVHQSGYNGLKKEITRQDLEGDDLGMRILGDVFYNNRIHWGSLDAEGAIHSQEYLKVDPRTLGWMVMVPSDHDHLSRMKRTYEYSNLPGDAPRVAVKPFTVSPQWAAILDARWYVHLHDTAMKLEGRGSSERDYLYGDYRGFVAQMAAAELASGRRYYQALDAMLRQYQLSTHKILDLQVNPLMSQQLSHVLQWADAAVCDVVAHSQEEQDSRNGIHLVSLGLRYLKDASRDDHIAFMQSVRSIVQGNYGSPGKN